LSRRVSINFFFEFTLRRQQSDSVPIICSKFATSVVDTIGKLPPGINDTDGKFAAGICNTGGISGKFYAGGH
jgi:hypothetical protein